MRISTKVEGRAARLSPDTLARHPVVGMPVSVKGQRSQVKGFVLCGLASEHAMSVYDDLRQEYVPLVDRLMKARRPLFDFLRRFLAEFTHHLGWEPVLMKHDFDFASHNEAIECATTIILPSNESAFPGNTDAKLTCTISFVATQGDHGFDLEISNVGAVSVQPYDPTNNTLHPGWVQVFDLIAKELVKEFRAKFGEFEELVKASESAALCG